jgi:cyclomaltodextrinase / maltogenic alpha-amylase / neopullulanase
MRFFQIIFWVFCQSLFACQEKRPELPQQNANTIVGIATPIKLNFDSTRIIWLDYFPNAEFIDSFDLPVGLTHISIPDGSGIKINGVLERGIDNLRVFIKGKGYDIPVFRSKKVGYLFRFQDPNKIYQSVTLSGSMNGWVSTRDSLLYSNGTWFRPFVLDPGKYQYHLFINGEEVLDPQNPDSVDNGFGGFNSTFEIQEEGESPRINTDSVSLSSFSYIDLSSCDGYSIYWQNHLLPQEYIEKIGQKIIVSIPRLAQELERSLIRIWGSKGVLRSNDLLIPLSFGKVIQNPELINRKDQQSLIMYFALVDRFFDGDSSNNFPTPDPDIKALANNLGGDISGILQKLNEGYFDKLEVNTIWLSPIGRNPDGAWGLWDKGGVKSKFSGYHGYWPARSKQLDPRFGKDEDLRNLIASAHQKDYSVLIDYVANHVHQDHPVYKLHPEWATELYLPDGSLNTERWDEYRLTTWFDTFLPTLDLENPVVTEAMSDSALYWFLNFDIDGFRHDATKHVPEIFWRTLTHKIKTQVMIPQGRSVYQIGETYGNPELIGSYISSGMLDAQFDFNFYDASVGSIGRDDISFERLGKELQKSLEAYGHHHVMGNMSGNQDRARFISYADGSVDWAEDAKLAGWTRDIDNRGDIGYRKLAMLHALNMTVPGVPVIYYGDEIGLPGANDPDNRRMMIFENLNSPQRDLKEKLSKLCRFRRNYLSLTFGETKILQASQDRFVLLRSYFSESAVLMINNSEKEILMDLPVDDFLRCLSFSGINYSPGQPVSIPPQSFEILIINK